MVVIFPPASKKGAKFQPSLFGTLREIPRKKMKGADVEAMAEAAGLDEVITWLESMQMK